MADNEHIGRFAPSPTGPLHMGSLVAALGSWLCARKQGGKWLLRIEDLDPPREQPGAADAILRALEAHGLQWDGEVVYQSQRQDRYRETVKYLIENGLAYHCHCSRKELAENARVGDMGPIYPGTCRLAGLRQGAVRLTVDNRPIEFDDLRVGHVRQDLEVELGDFVIQRRDGLFAYQLAVVVDDELQNITDVVRGADLLDNTPRQIFLQQRLGMATPRYLHLPLMLNSEGQKLSKQNLAPALDNARCNDNLLTALRFLGFKTPASIQSATTRDILGWVLNECDWNKSAIAAYSS